ncbi:MAG: hypothetical protein ACT443_03615 [Gemmatimonadota bacterium]
MPDFLAARSYELVALAALGRAEEIDKLLPEAAAISAQRAVGTPIILLSVALELEAHGRGRAAKSYFDQAVAWYDSLPAVERAQYEFQRAIIMHNAGRAFFGKSFAADSMDYSSLATVAIDSDQARRSACSRRGIEETTRVQATVARDL